MYFDQILVEICFILIQEMANLFAASWLSFFRGIYAKIFTNFKI